MKNPWEEIPLDDYEKHMSLDSVMQLQTMNTIMKEQLGAYPVRTAMILGVAGGNGLGHVDSGKYDKVYGVDINEEYLQAAAERYAELSGILQCLRVDLMSDYGSLPHAGFVIANLLVEYIGYESFGKVIGQVDPEYVSCAIQINKGEGTWVSDSPYLHVFDGLDAVHHQMEESHIVTALKNTGYTPVLRQEYPLPNGKSLLRLDFRKG